MLVVSYNPGYQNLLKGMKPSTKQRFISLEFNYPNEEVEKEIVIKESGVDEEIALKLVRIAKEIRNLDDVEIGEAVSTRLLIYAAKLIVQGFKPYEACIHSIIYSLSDDEELIEVLKKLVKLYFVN